MTALMKYLTVLCWDSQARFFWQQQPHLRRTFRAQPAVKLPTGSTTADSARPGSTDGRGGRRQSACNRGGCTDAAELQHTQEHLECLGFHGLSRYSVSE